MSTGLPTDPTMERTALIPDAILIACATARVATKVPTKGAAALAPASSAIPPFRMDSCPEITADNNGSERELRPTATYRKVTGGFRSEWGANLCLPQVEQIPFWGTSK
jgi:hypothetical protein